MNSIAPDVYMSPDTKLGSHLRIGPGTKLGVEPLQIKIVDGKHRRDIAKGRLILGDHVDIGSNCVLNRGVDGDTIIHPYVFIGHLSSIGHDAEIGENTVISAHVCVLGHVKIGKWCYIGPQTVIRNRKTIGDYTVIGEASNVTKDIPSSIIAYGNPCKFIRENPWRPDSVVAHPLRD